MPVTKLKELRMLRIHYSEKEDGDNLFNVRNSWIERKGDIVEFDSVEYLVMLIEQGTYGVTVTFKEVTLDEASGHAKAYRKWAHEYLVSLKERGVIE